MILALTHWVAKINLIYYEDRHQLKSTLITSQFSIKHWHDYIGEPTIADAIIDRLINQSHQLVLKILGDSMRKDKKIN